MGDKVRALFLLGTDRAMTEGSTAGCNSIVLVQVWMGCWAVIKVDCYVDAG